MINKVKIKHISLPLLNIRMSNLSFGSFTYYFKKYFPSELQEQIRFDYKCVNLYWLGNYY